MNYSISYNNKHLSDIHKDAIEYRSNVIDASIEGKKWLIENPSHIEKLDNVTFALGFHKSDLIIEAQKKNIPFMLLEPIQNWEYLYFAVAILGVSQVRISGELGFDIEKVAAFCHKHGVLVRLQDCNKPSSHFTELNPLEKFFVLPNWVEYLEGNVDILEFSDPTTEKTLINIYCKFGKWLGDLDILTEGELKDIDATTLPQHMGPLRLRCKRDCLKGGQCRFCNYAIELAELMHNNQLIWEKGEKDEQ